MFTLESPHGGDSNVYTQDTIFIIKKEYHIKLSRICRYESFSKGLKNEFETAVVNEPSVFEPLKFYCISCFQKYYQDRNVQKLVKPVGVGLIH